MVPTLCGDSGRDWLRSLGLGGGLSLVPCLMKDCHSLLVDLVLVVKFAATSPQEDSYPYRTLNGDSFLVVVAFKMAVGMV